MQKILIMGIQYLNSYIKQNTNEESINKINLSRLYGKVIAVDTSIYLYRFLADETLLENMYIMISLFKSYNITPIFIFDGKPPVEKLELLKLRNNNKITSEKQYNYIRETLKTEKSLEKCEELYENMLILKKKFIRLKRSDFINVQELMDAYGVTYIEATGEADELCAKLVQKKIAYACLSEDMDLFLYGCPRVLRYLSLINETVVIYYLDNILNNLKLSFKEFKEICVVSGTDYNLNNNNLYETLKYFKLYKNSNNYNISTDFYTWLDNNTNYIDNIYKLYNIYNMFTTENIILKKIKIKFKQEINLDKIKKIMKLEGFIFI